MIQSERAVNKKSDARKIIKTLRDIKRCLRYKFCVYLMNFIIAYFLKCNIYPHSLLLFLLIKKLQKLKGFWRMSKDSIWDRIFSQNQINFFSLYGLFQICNKKNMYFLFLDLYMFKVCKNREKNTCVTVLVRIESLQFQRKLYIKILSRREYLIWEFISHFFQKMITVFTVWLADVIHNNSLQNKLILLFCSSFTV